MTGDMANMIVALLGGGLLGTLISIWAQSHGNKRESERKHLDEALRELYGPVLHLLSECQMLCDENIGIHDQYGAHFKQRFDESAHEVVRAEMEATLETANQYTQTVIERIGDVLNIARSNWHLLDPKDWDLFEDIRRNHTRLRIESETPHGRNMPIEITISRGSPSLYKPEWYSVIKDSYSRKYARYHCLAGGCRWWHRRR